MAEATTPTGSQPAGNGLARAAERLKLRSALSALILSSRFLPVWLATIALVTADGCEILTRFPAEELLVTGRTYVRGADIAELESRSGAREPVA